MDWITQQIAIGNFVDAQNAAGCVDHILCLKPNCCAGRTDVNTTCIPLYDGKGNAPELYARAVRVVHRAVEKGETILVHCHAGRSRSVAVVARHLMEQEGVSRDEALQHIATKRDIYLSPGIEEAFARK